MPAEPKGKHYSLIIKDEELCDKIDQEPNKIKHLIDIITRYYAGEFVAVDSIDASIKAQQLNKLKLQNVNENIKTSVLKTRIKNLKSHTRYNNARTNFLENFNQMPSQSGLRELKKNPEMATAPLPPAHEQNPIIPGQNYLQCIDCGTCIVFDLDKPESVTTAKENYCDHIFKKHNRDIYPAEGKFLRGFSLG